MFRNAILRLAALAVSITVVALMAAPILETAARIVA